MKYLLRAPWTIVLHFELVKLIVTVKKKMLQFFSNNVITFNIIPFLTNDFDKMNFFYH